MRTAHLQLPFTCIAFVVAAAALCAKAPDWVVPLIAQDTSELGKGHTIVRLADIARIRYTPELRRSTRYLGAIRVMTLAGRDAARCAQHYNADTEKLVSARGWILSADGKAETVVPFNGFTDWAAKYDGVFWPQQRVVQYDAEAHIEVGGVFVWEIEIESKTSAFDYTWRFPTSTSTLLCQLEVTPPAGATLQWHANSAALPAPVAGPGGSLRWEERNFRAPEVADRPTAFLPAPRFVSLRSTPVQPGTQRRTWADVARLACDVIEPRLVDTSPELTAKAAQLVAGNASRWDRIRALAEFVQKEITYLSVTLDKDDLAGYRPHSVTEVLRNRFGDCKDKVTLLIAMLRAVGETGLPMLVFSGDPTAVMPNWPSPRFNHMIVCIPADAAVPATWPVVDAGALGRVVLFDPTSSFVPLGLLPSEDQGGHGLVVSTAAAELVALPTSRDETVREVSVDIDTDGNATISMLETSIGNIAARERGRHLDFGHEKYTQHFESRLYTTCAAIDGLRLDVEWSPSQPEWRRKSVFMVPLHARRFGQFMLVRPQILAAREPVTPWATTLDGTVWSPESTHVDKVVIKLPAGAAVDEVPQDWHGEVEQLSGSVRYERTSIGVTSEFKLQSRAGFVGKPAYEAARTLLLEALHAAQRPIVFRPAAN